MARSSHVRTLSRFYFSSSVVCLLCCFTHPAISTAIGDPCPHEYTHCAPWCADFYIRGGTLYSYRLNCRCDRNCVVYGDCCTDYLDHCTNDRESEWTLRSMFASHMVCVSPFDPDGLEGYLAVGRCPLGWPGDDVRQNCESETLARSQKFLNLLVSGPNDIVFKNVYCALCHGITDLAFWKLELWDCEPADGETPLWFGGKPDFDTCTSFKIASPLSMLSAPHRCYQDFVDSCPATTNATCSQTALCGNYTSLLFNSTVIGKITAYKNIHCAYCNGASLLRQGNDILQCSYHPQGLLDPSHSIRLLFDFTAHTVHSEEDMGLPWLGAGGAQKAIGNCSGWQLYDPFLDVCRDFSCTVGRVLQMGECVESKHQITTEGSLSDCLQPVLSRLGLENNFGRGRGSSVDGQANIYVDLSVAARIQAALHHFFSDDNMTFPCNATTVAIVAVAQANASASRAPVCEGFLQDNVELSEIGFENGVHHINISGYVYEETEFVHHTKYEIVDGILSREVYLVLCDPFVGNSCPVLTFDRSEFLIFGVGAEVAFVHKASGRSLNGNDVWQLPDGTLRMCNFLLGLGALGYPAWLTTLADFSFAGSVLSLVVLVLVLITYTRFTALRNQPGKVVMNLTVALILGQVVIMVGKISVPWLCVTRAALLHYAWLAVFAWMCILAGDLAHSMRSARPPPVRDGSGGRKVLKLGAVGWGFPAVFVAVCVLVSRTGRDRSDGWLEYGGSQCWIVDPVHALLVFGVPSAILLLINCSFLAVMIYTVTANRRRLAKARMTTNAKREIVLCSKLMVLTGVTWSLFFAANLIDVITVWYLAVFVNSLQGALMGLTFLLKANVRALWRRQLATCFCRRPCRQEKDPNLPPTAKSISLAVVPGGGTSARFVEGVEDGDTRDEGQADADPSDINISAQC